MRNYQYFTIFMQNIQHKYENSKNHFKEDINIEFHYNCLSVLFLFVILQLLQLPQLSAAFCSSIKQSLIKIAMTARKRFRTENRVKQSVSSNSVNSLSV